MPRIRPETRAYAFACGSGRERRPLTVRALRADIYDVRALVVLMLGVAVLLLVALRETQSSASPQPSDIRLARIASSIAHRPVQIHCEGRVGVLVGPDGESGSVEFVNGKPGNAAVLQEGVCETLHRYSRAVERRSCLLPCDGSALPVAWSLNALAHEAYHLAGVRSEAQTECYALQTVDYVAQQLGASPEQARRVASFAGREVLARMPRDYHSPACREGGAFDLGARGAGSRKP